MFIKCINGKSYINTNQIFGLFVEINTEDIIHPQYCVKAGMDADGTECYILESYDSKTEAEAALERLIAKINGQQQAPAQNVVTTGECIVHKTLSPETRAHIAAVARAAAAPCKQKPLPPSPSEALAKELRYLADDFASSGETDNLLRMTAYIRAYLAQEAKNE